MEYIMNAPQITWLVLTLLATGLVAARHGNHYDDNYSFGALAFVTALLVGLYYWGGFFETFGAPQAILVGAYALIGGIYLAKNGEPKLGKYNILTSLASSAAWGGLLYWGGFFN
jgi:hypothetical protein